MEKYFRNAGGFWTRQNAKGLELKVLTFEVARIRLIVGVGFCVDGK
jgi:hypothetical protein